MTDTTNGAPKTTVTIPQALGAAARLIPAAQRSLAATNGVGTIDLPHPILNPDGTPNDKTVAWRARLGLVAFIQLDRMTQICSEAIRPLLGPDERETPEAQEAGNRVASQVHDALDILTDDELVDMAKSIAALHDSLEGKLEVLNEYMNNRRKGVLERLIAEAQAVAAAERAGEPCPDCGRVHDHEGGASHAPASAAREMERRLAKALESLQQLTGQPISVQVLAIPLDGPPKGSQGQKGGKGGNGSQGGGNVH